MPLPADLLNPIPGSNPGGADLLNDPILTKIKEARKVEVGLLDVDEERKTADYPLVIKLASEALATKSKDLWVAAWLTEALLRRNGFGGLQQGLALLTALVEKFWDHLYPQLEDGDADLRVAPLSWVGGDFKSAPALAVKSTPLNQGGHDLLRYKEARLLGYEHEVEGDAKRKEKRSAAVAEGKLTPEQFDRAFEQTLKAWYKELVVQLNGCSQELAALDALSRQKFGEDAPNYRPLEESVSEVSDVARQLLAKKLELEPDPPELDSDGLALSAAGAEAKKVVSMEPTDAADAAARIAAAAHFLQRQAPTNPASYLLLRGFRWGELRVRGGDLDPRLLSAPPTQLRTSLKRLLLDEKWEQLLEQGETVMATTHGRGWLDLQRYVLTACYKLGGEYEAVATAIVSALTALLRDLPQLPELTLMDDTPTANEETRAWLRDSGISQAAAAEAQEAEAIRQGAAAAPSARRAVDRARGEVRAGRPEKAIEILMAEVDLEKSERARFLRRAEIAGIMVEAGHEPVALPILNELLQKVDAHKLEEWEEGAVVAHPLGLLYRCLSSAGGSEDAKQQLYRRICRLDPVRALDLPGKKAESREAAPAPARSASPPKDEASVDSGQEGS